MGKTAVAVDEFVSENGRYIGTVRVHGELWRAVCSERIRTGQSVTVTGSEGLTLFVQPAGESAP